MSEKWLKIAGASVLALFAYYQRPSARKAREYPSKTIDLISKPVLITGCDSGFGAMLAQDLLDKGYSVIATFLKQEQADAFLSQHSSVKDRLFTFKMDVTSDADVEYVNQQVEKAFPLGLYGLVNNAGVADGFLFEATTMEQDEFVFAVNVFGVVRVSRSFASLLRKYRRLHPNDFRPRIVNVASVAGKVSSTRLSAYSASKFAVEAYSDSMRQEFAPFGVLVSIIEPYFAKTNIVSDISHGTSSFETKQLSKTAQRWPTLDVAKLYPCDFLQKHEEYYEYMMKNGKTLDGNPILEPKVVVDTLSKAIQVNTPQTRYLVVPTPIGKIIITLATILPAWFGDAVVRRGDTAAGLLPLRSETFP